MTSELKISVTETPTPAVQQPVPPQPKFPMWPLLLGFLGWLAVPLCSATAFVITGGHAFDFGVFFEPYAVSLGAIGAISGALFEMSRRDAENREQLRDVFQKVEGGFRELGLRIERGQARLHRIGTLVDRYINLHGGKRPDVIGRFADRIVERVMNEFDQLAGDAYSFYVQSKSEQYSRSWLASLNDMIRGKGRFSTVTNMVIWTGDNLGFRNGYSAYHDEQLRSSVELGYDVRRLFVLPGIDDLKKRPEDAKRIREVLGHYLRAVEQAQDQCAGAPRKRLRHETMVLVCPNEDRYRQHFMDESRERPYSENIAIWEASHYGVVNTVAYRPRPDESHLTAYEISEIGFTWDPAVVKEKASGFEALWTSSFAVPLEAYLEKLTNSDAAAS